MYRLLYFFAIFLFLPGVSLFSATEDSKEYLSQLENQLRVDMGNVDQKQSNTKILPTSEAGKEVSISSDSQGNGIAQYFTSIPETNHSLVDYYIQYYTSFGKKNLEDFLDRFRDYFPVIRKYALKEQLPMEVALIPIVESGLRTDAVRYKRTGMWLLSENIAQIYGLRMGEYVDERFDLEKSTESALKYFSSLLKAFNNDWDFALTAFNGGGTLLQKEIRTLQVGDFWDLYDKKGEIPLDSLEYVPKFYALLTILKHPSRYSIHVPSFDDGAVSFTKLPLVKSGVAFKDIAKLTNVSIEKIVSLNPQLSRQYTVAGATLYIPANTQYLMKSRIRVAKAIRLRHLSYGRGDGTSFSFRPYTVGEGVAVAKSKGKSNYYRVKAKDTLYSIAKKTNSSIQGILKQNKDLSLDSVLKVGKLLKIAKSTPTSKKSKATTTSSRGVSYTVKSGDTLYSIAKNYSVPMGSVRSKNGSKIKPGDRLVILR